MKTAATWVCIESGRFRFSTVKLIMKSDRLSISHWLYNCTNSNTACTMKENNETGRTLCVNYGVNGALLIANEIVANGKLEPECK